MPPFRWCHRAALSAVSTLPPTLICRDESAGGTWQPWQRALHRTQKFPNPVVAPTGLCVVPTCAGSLQMTSVESGLRCSIEDTQGTDADRQSLLAMTTLLVQRHARSPNSFSFCARNQRTPTFESASSIMITAYCPALGHITRVFRA